jgi:hypothetical protein
LRDTITRNPERKRSLWKLRRRYEDNITIYLKGKGYDVDWIHLAETVAQLQCLVNTIINL